jgi:arginase
MKLRLILVPYDSGQREWRMGKGPSHLLRNGIASSVRTAGNLVTAEFVEHDHHMPSEVGSSFALYRMVSRRVRQAVEAGELPVVLGGNCGATLGVVAGIGGDPAVVWLDAHGDFNTPETSGSGFLDGMALSILTGRCWRTMAESIPGFSPLPEELAVLVGARAIDEREDRELERSEVRLVRAGEVRASGVRASLGSPLEAMAHRARRVHLHIDFDVLDPTEVGRANEFAVEGGLTLAHLEETIRLVASRFTIAGVTLSAYDPDYDHSGGIFSAAVLALELITRMASAPQQTLGIASTSASPSGKQ